MKRSFSVISFDHWILQGSLLFTYICMYFLTLFSVSDLTMLTIYWVVTTAIIRRLFPVVFFSFRPISVSTQRRNTYSTSHNRTVPADNYLKLKLIAGHPVGISWCFSSNVLSVSCSGKMKEQLYVNDMETEHFLSELWTSWIPENSCDG